MFTSLLSTVWGFLVDLFWLEAVVLTPFIGVAIIDIIIKRYFDK